MEFICSYCGYECEIIPADGYEDDYVAYCPRCGETKTEDLELNSD